MRESSPPGGRAIKYRNSESFCFTKDELNIGYDTEFTKTAQQTFDSGSGNCLSLTSLFVAAARHVGFNAYFESVSVRPTWDYQRKTMIRYKHVVATGRVAAATHYVVDFLPEFSLDDRSKHKISDRVALGLYFNNIGGENLVLGNTETAIDNLQQALFVDLESSDAWNNMGAAYRRIGKKELAEFSYRKAILLDRYNYSALTNLARFYEKENQLEKAEKFISRVERYQASNPYFLAAAGKLLLDMGRFDASLNMLARSIQLKEDEPAFYLTSAELYTAMGKENLAEEFRSEAQFRHTARPEAPVRQMNPRFWTYRMRAE